MSLPFLLIINSKNIALLDIFIEMNAHIDMLASKKFCSYAVDRYLSWR
ncbi:hypothetical protein SynA1528_00147 [Synechococcus sp. A15-28]|nr:hypothetical protein SynA1528_00147 [Synechococcus sp. A15-28]